MLDREGGSESRERRKNSCIILMPEWERETAADEELVSRVKLRRERVDRSVVRRAFPFSFDSPASSPSLRLEDGDPESVCCNLEMAFW